MWCHLSRLRLKTTSEKMREIWGCGIREKWVHLLFIAHPSSLLEASSSRLHCIVGTPRKKARLKITFSDTSISLLLKSNCDVSIGGALFEKEPVNSHCLLSFHYDTYAANLSVTEVSQAGTGIYQSPEGAGDLTEDKPYRVINTYLFWWIAQICLLVHEA